MGKMFPDVHSAGRVERRRWEWGGRQTGKGFLPKRDTAKSCKDASMHENILSAGRRRWE